MFNWLTLTRFRCFPSLKVPLKPLTVLIGPNDAGKTAFLKAISFLGSSPNSISGDDTWKGTSDGFVVEARTENGQRYYVRSKEREINGIGSLRYFQLPVHGVAMISEGVASALHPPEIDQEGNGVPTLFDYFLREDRPRFDSALGELLRLAPGIRDLKVTNPDPKKRGIDFLLKNGFRLPGDRASAGLRLLLFFVALAFHPQPPSVILLEEPETGIHPKRLAEVMALLRAVTEGQHGGPPAQVILSTHSPYLLDLVDLEKDQVLVFRQKEDGSRAAEPADRDRLKDFLDEFMLGEIWFNQGEEGLVAKSP